MFERIRKRDGSLEKFYPEKITWAIFKAAAACGGDDFSRAEELSTQVIELALRQYGHRIPEVEGVQDIVEKVLIENGHARTAKAYILYREKRAGARNLNALIGATIDMFSDYLGDKDWRIKENANTQKSINGLNNYVRESFTKNYWLHEIYPAEVREAHESGAIHIHDLGFLGPYCAGWDLRQVLMNGFGGVVTFDIKGKFLAFVYQITQFSEEWNDEYGFRPMHEMYTECMPGKMTAVVRQVEKPCLSVLNHSDIQIRLLVLVDMPVISAGTRAVEMHAWAGAQVRTFPAKNRLADAMSTILHLDRVVSEYKPDVIFIRNPLSHQRK